MALDASFFLRRNTDFNTWMPQFVDDPGVDVLFYLADATKQFTAMNLPIAATFGGTGFASYAVGDLLYADTTSTLAKLADIATGNVLLSGGVGVAPAFGKVGLTTHVSGVLPVTNGGTGLSAAALGDILYGSGANTLGRLAGNTTTTRKFQRQVGDGVNSAAPAWDTLVAGDIPDLSGVYQPLDGDLTAIAALTSTGILQRTGSNTWSMVSIGSSLSYAAGALDTIQDIRTSASPIFRVTRAVAANSKSTSAFNDIVKWESNDVSSPIGFYATLVTDPTASGRLGYFEVSDASVKYTMAFQPFGGRLLLGQFSDDGSTKVQIGGAIKTDTPSGGSAGAWKLGTYSSGLVRIDISGTGYDLAASGQDLRTSATPQLARLGLGAAADSTYLLNLNGALVHGTSTGIGIGTTAPGYKLEVAGTFGTFAAAGFITSESTGADGNQAGLQAVGPGNANWLIVTNKSSLTGAADTLGFYKNAGTTGLKLAITNAGLIQGKRFVPTAGTPSAVGKGAAGTGPTVSVTGTDSGFRLTVVVGTSPNANDDIAWIDFNTAFAAAPFVVVTGNTNLSADVYTSGTTTSRIFFSVRGTLAAGATYKWDFVVVGA